MNPSLDQPTESIRSDIDTTRERMDDTIDKLGDRLQGRHLVDEVIGFFRSDNPDNRGRQIREKITSGAQSAASSVAETVKAHPVPLLLVGAGVAWMIYRSRRSTRDQDDYVERYSAYEDDLSGRVRIGVPANMPEVAGTDVEFGGESGGLQESSYSGYEESDESNLARRGREKLQAAKSKLSDMSQSASQRSRELYQQARERVSSTAEQHPIGLGLGCLAAGLLIGLAIPAPEAVTRRIAPTIDRLRDRTRRAGTDLLEKGKRVARAASDAARDEAQHQGLTSDQLKSSASAVADRTKDAAKSAAKDEGLVTTGPSSPNAGA